MGLQHAATAGSGLLCAGCVTCLRRAGARRPSRLVPPPPSSPAILLDIDPLLADLVPDYVREKRRQAVDLRRLVAGNAFEAEIDKQGRILLPPTLRQHAGIALGIERAEGGGEVGAALGHRHFKFFNKQAFSAHFGQGAIQNLIASGRHS